MDKEFKGLQDDQIKELLASTKIRASENLKHRIMHQIETEKALAQREIKARKSKNIDIPNIFSVLGIAYLLILAMGIGIYYYGGTEALISTTSLGAASLIIATGSAYWMICYFDSKLKIKHKP